MPRPAILLDLAGPCCYGWEMAATREQIQETIDVFVRAAEANRATPARRGNVIVLGADNADDCLITGNLHGHLRNFDAIMKLADLDSHPRRHLVVQVVCHGGPTHHTPATRMSTPTRTRTRNTQLEAGHDFDFTIGANQQQ